MKADCYARCSTTHLCCQPDVTICGKHIGWSTYVVTGETGGGVDRASPVSLAKKRNVPILPARSIDTDKEGPAETAQ
jgi:hypothetical protein